ncbi:Protein of uncharacterised function (DUF1490) [Mycobacterium tuberculosis]|nr:Protein of uncharacterised function (DUF1490) [Mycobacterium tuberculosis]
MAIQVFLAKATTTVITGLAGVTAYEILKKAAAKAPFVRPRYRQQRWVCAEPARPRKPRNRPA